MAPRPPWWKAMRGFCPRRLMHQRAPAQVSYALELCATCDGDSLRRQSAPVLVGYAGTVQVRAHASCGRESKSSFLIKMRRSGPSMRIQVSA